MRNFHSSWHNTDEHHERGNEAPASFIHEALVSISRIRGHALTQIL
jgi:hypothetical protein